MIGMDPRQAPQHPVLDLVRALAELRLAIENLGGTWDEKTISIAMQDESFNRVWVKVSAFFETTPDDPSSFTLMGISFFRAINA